VKYLLYLEFPVLNGNMSQIEFGPFGFRYNTGLTHLISQFDMYNYSMHALFV
jgi:hypothetical protein